MPETNAVRLRSVVADLAGHSDLEWYRYILTKDLYSGSLTETECADIIRGSMQAAGQLQEQLTQGGEILPAQEYARQQGLQVTRRFEGVADGFLCMGMFRPPASIILYEDVAAAAVRFVVQGGLEHITPPEQIGQFALFHELFHALEEKTPGIYTRSHMLKRKRLGLFEYRRGLDAASEIGAVHFSKLMGNIEYSPCIFELYLLWMTKQLSVGALPWKPGSVL